LSIFLNERKKRTSSKGAQAAKYTRNKENVEGVVVVGNNTPQVTNVVASNATLNKGTPQVTDVAAPNANLKKGVPQVINVVKN
jgi:hypothetical protein